MTYSEDKAQREKERSEDASLENEASPPSPMVSDFIKRIRQIKRQTALHYRQRFN